MFETETDLPSYFRDYFLWMKLTFGIKLILMVKFEAQLLKEAF